MTKQKHCRWLCVKVEEEEDQKMPTPLFHLLLLLTIPPFILLHSRHHLVLALRLSATPSHSLLWGILSRAHWAHMGPGQAILQGPKTTIGPRQIPWT